MTALARPTTCHYATDPSPEATRLAVLAKLAEYPQAWHERRDLGRLVYGTDKVGGSRIASAVGWLRNERLVDTSAATRRLRINPAGLAFLDMADR